MKQIQVTRMFRAVRHLKVPEDILEVVGEFVDQHTCMPREAILCRKDNALIIAAIAPAAGVVCPFTIYVVVQ